MLIHSLAVPLCSCPCLRLSLISATSSTLRWYVVPSVWRLALAWNAHCGRGCVAQTKSEKYLWQYRVIKRLCLIGGFTLFMRFVLAPYLPGNAITGYESTEWLRGEKLCTFHGKFHLAWSVPMADPTYYIPGAAIHSFLMFAPFFALYEKKGMVVQGVFLWMTGPFLASFITDNLMEQASIWCFFSIAQISTMLFLIRETLIVHWGKDGEARTSLLAKRAASKEARKNK